MLNLFKILYFIFQIKMATLQSLPALSGLAFMTEEDGGSWTWFDSFMTLMRQRQSPVDGKQMRPFSVLREISGMKNGQRQVENKVQISLEAILRYIFHHADDFVFCRLVTNEVLLSLQKGSSPPPISSVHQIYQNIADLKLKDSIIEHTLLSQLSLKKEEIPTLYLQYKNDFECLAWKRICFLSGTTLRSMVQEYLNVTVPLEATLRM